MKSPVNHRPSVDNVPTSASFGDELKAGVHRLLRNSDLSLRQLALQMEGAYPTDLIAAIESLRADGVEVNLLDEPCNDSASGDNSAVREAELPEPHPLDYDWRFGAESLSLLSRMIAETRAERIAILGAPTLFLHLAKKCVSTSLYDKNSHLVETLQSLGFSSVNCCDLFEARFERPDFDAVVADPPWYSEHYASFIQSSADLLIPGGVLLLSVLPRLTRPTAAVDRLKILHDAYESGLDLVDIHPSALAYDSPPFEQASLKAESISLKSWRRGDLFVFRRSTVTRRQPSEFPIERDSRWSSFSVGRTIVRVRSRSSDSASIDYGPVSPSGDVHLHSVSRRAPFRAGIDVWNSRNLALWMTRPDYLCEILSDHERGLTFDEAIAEVTDKANLDDRNSQTLRQVVNLLLEDAKAVDHA